MRHYECDCVRLEVRGVSCLSCLNVAFEDFLFPQNFGVHDIVVVDGCWIH